ncbi:hypothetical protein [Pusillimonas sp.]|uniref:YdcA family protein n=1 Tax=Pusillimonas sp. TaxID=3040095 RepID=UPI0039B968B3
MLHSHVYFGRCRDRPDLRRRKSASVTAATRWGQVIRLVLFLVFGLALAQSAQAANTPCSGKKGGISHCAAGKFVCNDGSISGSKKICTAPSGQAQGLLAAPKSKSATSCDCRSGTFCTGPRGGTYCYSDSGKKSYVRK